LRDDRDRFEAAGATVVLVGLGTPEQAEGFCRKRGVPFACLTSPDGEAHRAFGLRRGTLSQLAGPRMWGPWLRATARGHHQGRLGQGDPTQLPGTFVVDTGGVVRYAHRGRRADDTPPNGHVLDALAALREA
jgi:peroxiredoxin